MKGWLIMEEIIQELVNCILSIIGMFVFVIILGMFVATVDSFNSPTEQETCSELVRAVNQRTLTDNDDRIITWNSIAGRQIARQCRMYIK